MKLLTEDQERQMSADRFMLDGRAYSWRKLCELRREQLEARRKAEGFQPVLFELREDCRPAAERTAAGRYSEPNLLDWPASRPAQLRASDGIRRNRTTGKSGR